MRTIKFRAWLPGVRKMKFVRAMDWDMGIDEGTEDCPASVDFTDRAREEQNWALTDNGAVILMQFTGLTDKNGKEIFEGDILSVVVIGKFIEWIVTVTWSDLNNGWMVVHEESGNGRLYNINFDLIEVIGNIWENPSLLEGTK